MRTALAFCRSLAFALVFYGVSVLWVIMAVVVAALSPRSVRPIANGWARFHHICARWLLGQRVEVSGDPGSGPRFYILKHEAMFETVELLCLLQNPVIAAKRELLAIPLWGGLARAYGVLEIDREAGAKALRGLRASALTAIDGGRPLCLFPEGTRVPHGEAPPLKSGFAGLYKLLGLPVVPVALDTGRLNGRGRFIRRPGVIRVHFGTPIPPGLPRAEAEALAHAAINRLNGTNSVLSDSV